MPMVEIEVPENIAEQIAALLRETVSRLLIEQIERRADETAPVRSDEAPAPGELHPGFAKLLRQAQELVAAPPKRPMTLFEQGIQDKLRKQGFHFPEDEES